MGLGGKEVGSKGAGSSHAPSLAPSPFLCLWGDSDALKGQ